VPKIDFIEIQFKDLLLAETPFDLEGKGSFEEFALYSFFG